jgi:hypothetical protein
VVKDNSLIHQSVSNNQIWLQVGRLLKSVQMKVNICAPSVPNA